MNKVKMMTKIKRELPLHLMLLPSVLLLIIFAYVPMIGIVMAFQNYSPALGFFGSEFVDIYNFTVLFARADFKQVLVNTVVIAGLKIVLTTFLGILLALFLNEVTAVVLKKAMQTTLFMPYFLSWALLGGLVIELLSYQGPVNYLLTTIFKIDPVPFMASNKWFRGILITTDLWKTIGYQVVVFLAVITNIDPSLYEAAEVDGANRLQKCMHITLPGMMSMIILVSILNVGNILNAGFEQVLVLYNPIVYESGDILDTMAYRIGLLSGDGFSTGAAIGLFKSLISCALFSASYFLAYKLKGYTIF